jgi:hypothetical protein
LCRFSGLIHAFYNYNPSVTQLILSIICQT